jgi:short-subunit dehydrogenase
MVRNKAIVVGASSGIGREIACKYAENGWKVGITGRRENLLKELKEIYPDQVIISVFDVTGQENIKQISELIENLGGLDLLIYNAGYGDPSTELNSENENLTTRTNVNGFVEIVSYTFNYFAQQGYGQIALTSSIAAIRGNSWAPSYSASKAFMSNYAEGLNIKAFKMKKNIVITDIKPGFIDTKMAKGNGRFWVAPVSKAVRQIIRGIEARKKVVYVTKRWWLIAQIMKIIPFSLYKRIG